jgi:hypothetical protein
MRARLPWLAGAILRGLVLGSLLFAALVKLLALSEGARVFRYENF